MQLRTYIIDARLGGEESKSIRWNVPGRRLGSPCLLSNDS